MCNVYNLYNIERKIEQKPDIKGLIPLNFNETITKTNLTSGNSTSFFFSFQVPFWFFVSFDFDKCVVNICKYT